ncbi:uncharacterized protein MAM_02293 [Metarhizium album ARSEF 1941]|uniref:Uncharacterized protein n=1 Tax=Metarhizium album (strain ARSEF 1941) TaxID=1081103 RepID=A0A0B2X2G7_METAS|nr:uncharacterized protein MAM_02293 [Metarhizium album ARSEF 1941]KHN99440.1 hypothetical protein MAM_02293 [Metarhizium album ARSEF 1941]
MPRAGFLLILTGTLTVLSTSVTICLEIISCVQAPDSSNLLIASSIAAAFEAAVLLILGALGLAQVVPRKVALVWMCSVPAFVIQLFAWLAALVASTAALVYLQQSWTLPEIDDVAAGRRWEVFVGLAIVVAFATALQLGFIVLHFVTSRDVTAGATSSFHTNEEGRKAKVKSIRYSRTLVKGAAKEKASVRGDEYLPSAPANSTMGPFDYLKASMSQAIRPTTSRTISSKDGRWRRTSLDSECTRKSTDTSFDSWDTSSVDAHNRQVVIEMSSPITLKRSLETIPASPSGSRPPTRPGTPLDMELEPPPRMLYRKESYSSSLLSQQDARRHTSDSSVNELHIHPLFRSDSPTPPPAASPGTSVLAAPNAGQVISCKSSMQSLKRLRSGSLPATRSPLVHHTSLDSLRQSKMRDDGDVGRQSSDGKGERKMTPPVPEWLLSPSMKASLESFREQRGGHDEEA